MQIIRGFRHPYLLRPCAVTIGNFDGVHLGHQAMLAKLIAQAKAQNLSSCVVTFEPHPRAFFSKHYGFEKKGHERIATLRDRLLAFQNAGIDQVLVLRFNAQMAACTAQQFIKDILVQGLHTHYVLIGNDFHFGRQREGDETLLKLMGQQYGFAVEQMPSICQEGQRLSSSSLREALNVGDMPRVHQILGRPYSISGHVVYGQQLGRLLGFPTLNMRFKGGLPAMQGIFVVQVHDLCEQALNGVASLGVRPTIESTGEPLLEVHCFSWPQRLGTEGGYGQNLRVDLLHKMRNEQKYASLDMLKQAINEDCALAKIWLSKHKL